VQFYSAILQCNFTVQFYSAILQCAIFTSTSFPALIAQPQSKCLLLLVNKSNCELHLSIVLAPPDSQPQELGDSQYTLRAIHTKHEICVAWYRATSSSRVFIARVNTPLGYFFAHKMPFGTFYCHLVYFMVIYLVYFVAFWCILPMVIW
jgi:hypothetical protein